MAVREVLVIGGALLCLCLMISVTFRVHCDMNKLRAQRRINKLENFIQLWFYAVMSTWSFEVATMAISFVVSSKCPSGSPMTLEELNECFICCEEYVDATKLDRCNHVFHTPCLTKWFSVAKAKLCPMCRSS